MNGLLTNWAEVIRISMGEPDLADPQKFTRDLIARAVINPQVDGFIYSFTIEGQVFVYVKQIGDTVANIATALISQVNSFRSLWGRVEASVGRTADEISLWADQCFDVVAVSSVGMGLNAANPLELGIRSKILLDAKRGASFSVYKNDTAEAQTLLAAHFASQALSPAPGKGSVSSQSFGSESIGWTMPTNNPGAGAERLMTIYGKRLYQLGRRNILAVVIG